jgi:hypothetical protein
MALPSAKRQTIRQFGAQGDGPKACPLTCERMKLTAWVPQCVDGLGCIECGQNFADALNHVGRKSFTINLLRFSRIGAVSLWGGSAPVRDKRFDELPRRTRNPPFLRDRPEGSI